MGDFDKSDRGLQGDGCVCLVGRLLFVSLYLGGGGVIRRQIRGLFSSNCGWGNYLGDWGRGTQEGPVVVPEVFGFPYSEARITSKEEVEERVEEEVGGMIESIEEGSSLFCKTFFFCSINLDQVMINYSELMLLMVFGLEKENGNKGVLEKR